MLQLDEISLEERCPSFITDVERWKASGPLGKGEIIIAPKVYIERAATLPQWGPFSRIELINERTIWVEGELKEDLISLRRLLGINASIGLSWHIASVLASLHDMGSAHGCFHPTSIGIDKNGELCIRPAIWQNITKEPDSRATSQATDCLLMADVLEVLGVSEESDELFSLLLTGLRRDIASIRLQPGCAIRQSISAIAARNPQWEKGLVEKLGVQWNFDQLRPVEHTVMPRSYIQENKKNISYQTKEQGKAKRKRRTTTRTGKKNIFSNLLSNSSKKISLTSEMQSKKKKTDSKTNFLQNLDNNNLGKDTDDFKVRIRLSNEQEEQNSWERESEQGVGYQERQQLHEFNLKTEEPALQINVPSDNASNQEVIEEKFSQVLHLKSDITQQQNPKVGTIQNSSEFQIIEEDWNIPRSVKQKNNEEDSKETAFHRIMSKIREEDTDDTQYEEVSLFGEQIPVYSEQSHDDQQDDFLELDEETEIAERSDTEVLRLDDITDVVTLSNDEHTIAINQQMNDRMEVENTELEREEQKKIEEDLLEEERLEKERLEAERVEADRLEAERLEEERLEAERLEQERLEEERLEAERVEEERVEAERLEAERLEAERLEAERLEAERLEAERLEAERLEEERLEAERVAAERLEAERLEVERLEKERLEAERLEAERLEKERLEAERLETERLESERQELEHQELERVEVERLEEKRLEEERLEAERLEAERLEQERLEEERLEAERLEAERLEAERLEAERLEEERLEAERLEAERLEAERLEAERLEAERLESERLESERLEEERLEAEKLEAERLEKERLEAERLETERLEAERLEEERVETERLEAERLEAERLEAERLEAERLEEERLEAERVEAERLESERVEKERQESERLEKERVDQELLEAEVLQGNSKYKKSVGQEINSSVGVKRRGLFGEEESLSTKPKWLGVTGVTQSTTREAELGTGKWDAQGRDVHKLFEAIPDAPIREIDIDIKEGRGWGGLLMSIMIVFLGGLTYFAFSMLQSESDTEAVVVKYQQKEIPIVQTEKSLLVETVPEGGVVLLNKMEIGVAPTLVPVLDLSQERVQRLCVRWGEDEPVCHRLQEEDLEKKKIIMKAYEDRDFE